MNLFNFFSFSSPAHSEIAENGADKVLSSEEENPSVHKTYVNFPTSRKSALDVPLYAISSGRSMVEMLGVLAIIGVLSVGAIAGYSKVMMKYKLNKQREQISQIMMSLIEYRSIFTSVNHGESIVPILIKLNALPKEMIKSTGSTSLYDNLSSSISIVRTNDDDVYFYYNMSSIADNNHTICRNILETFKEYSDVLYALGVNSDTEEEINQQDWYFGNNVHEYLKKINQLDINSMQTLCEKCDSNLCNIVAIVPSK